MITSWRECVTGKYDLICFPTEYADVLDLLEELLDVGSEGSKYLYLSELLRSGVETGLITGGEEMTIRSVLVGPNGFI
jgi:hypothetical protein